MGYSEQAACRALQQRRKLGEAMREWHHDETAQEDYVNAYPEQQEKVLEDVKSGNMSANIENAVEKLLSGAIVTTVVEEQVVPPKMRPPRAKEGAKDGAKEGEED